MPLNFLPAKSLLSRLPTGLRTSVSAEKLPRISVDKSQGIGSRGEQNGTLRRLTSEREIQLCLFARI